MSRRTANKKPTALVLTGGGARAAYQIGVLKTISEIVPGAGLPFDILCGASAGALNVVGLASSTDSFQEIMDDLTNTWTGLESDRIYRTDLWGMSRRISHFVHAFITGSERDMPASMLDSAPLRKFLKQEVDFGCLTQNIHSGKVDAVCITACGYLSGQSISFFQARDGLDGWHLGQRVGVKTTLGVDHLLASSAIPTIFPPVKIHREFFGDGVVRNVAPLSPAIRLGADKILIIGVSANRVSAPVRRTQHEFPSLAHIMEHMLNGVFLDTLENDLDKALLINHLLEQAPEARLQQHGHELRRLQLLDISPSQPIDDIALRHIRSLPSTVRKLLGQNKPKPEGGASLASYLLFEGPFLRDLIKLGVKDAHAHRRQIEQFFDSD